MQRYAKSVENQINDTFLQIALFLISVWFA